MKIFLQFILFLIVACIPVFIATSCNQEDDIDEIFLGKTWKITGACINGKTLNGTDLKELYLSDDSYKLTFTANQLTGSMAAGSSFAGTWQANGKKQTFSCTIQSETDINSTSLSISLFNILRTSQKYEGDSNVLILKSDNTNYIRLTKNG